MTIKENMTYGLHAYRYFRVIYFNFVKNWQLPALDSLVLLLHCSFNPCGNLKGFMYSQLSFCGDDLLWLAGF